MPARFFQHYSPIFLQRTRVIHRKDDSCIVQDVSTRFVEPKPATHAYSSLSLPPEVAHNAIRSMAISTYFRHVP